ncbi:hypothetical protein E2C01_069074 [Portunus trituberculatus]|uniref:Uncharacterized protein n=1 Tax=Portunus trituberculatus TaxID=210409 RepID=A0A5B7HQH7_PORTR|nr:hypothetical protein [Portunus trituberculatus]
MAGSLSEGQSSRQHCFTTPRGGSCPAGPSRCGSMARTACRCSGVAAWRLGCAAGPGAAAGQVGAAVT